MEKREHEELSPEAADDTAEDGAVARAVVDEFVSARGRSRGHCIALLQAVHDRLGYLPEAAMGAIAGALGLSETNVFGVATFYNQFRFVPPGRHPIKVCMGTACHIKGGQAILDVWKHKLGIGEGDVTSDREYSLDRVACVGCCAIAPVMLVGDEVEGKVLPTRVDGVLLGHRLARGQDATPRDDDKDDGDGHGGD